MDDKFAPPIPSSSAGGNVDTVNPNSNMAPRGSVLVDPTGSTQTGFLRLAPPVQHEDNHQESNSSRHSRSTAGVTTAATFPSSQATNVAMHPSSALEQQEMARERAYEEKMRLVQQGTQGKSNTTFSSNTATLPSQGVGDRKVAAMPLSTDLQREESRELAYQEKMRLAQAYPYQGKSNTTGNNTAKFSSSQGDGDSKVAAMPKLTDLQREESRELAYQEKMRLAQAHPYKGNSNTTGDGDSKVAAMPQSIDLQREESRELAYQEKMKLAQAHPYRPAQGPSTALALAPAVEGTTLVGGPDSTDQSRLPPGLGIATGQTKRDDWSSSTASLNAQSKSSLKSDLDDGLLMAKREYAENMKSQQQLMNTSDPVMTQLEQATSQKFEGEGLCLAPARAVSIDVTTTSPEETSQRSHRSGPLREYSDQVLLDEKRRMMEQGSQGHSSGKQLHEYMDWEKEAKLGGGRPHSLSYLPTTMQPDNHSSRATRGIQDLTIDKNALLIDPRAAPLEHHAGELSVMEAISASGTAQEFTISSAIAPSDNSSDWVPPSRRMRTPAEGYTVRAGNKGIREHSTAPGAIAVVRRPPGDLPGLRGRADSNDSLDAIDSTVSYSGTAEMTRSSRGEALSTSGVQGSENAPSTLHTSESFSHLPPEMREIARNQRAALFAPGYSSSLEGVKIDEKSGSIRRSVFIVFGILVLVMGIGIGLGVGLGGSSDATSETEAPTLPGNISFFQLLVEDFYDDGGTVFMDTNSPQYQALVWLASDADSESLDAARIRTLYALAVFYYSTNGPTWSEQHGFLNSTTDSMCKWNNGDRTYQPKGLWCDSTDTIVERLQFSWNNLVGTIPEEIGMLTDLQYLLVASNNLASTLPESLFALSDLKGVDVDSNSFTGSLPSTFVQATNLEILHLAVNLLHGPISFDHFFEGTSCPLQEVMLSMNTFTGTFPLESIAANCTNIDAINVYDSGLLVDGSIPSFGLEKLKIIDIGKTELGGSIPDDISRFSHLEFFKADYNALTGTIPASLGELTNLTLISLGNNGLDGSIPSTLGQLQKLTSLILQSNILTGSIPSELALCTSLVDVKLHMNFLTGDMDFLCPLGLNFLYSDCNGGDVTCSCCLCF